MSETDYTLEAIRNPRFAEAGRVHDWRNYISEEVQHLWDSFNEEQKSALYRWADDQAMNEHWD